MGHCSELVQQLWYARNPLDLCGYPSIGLGNLGTKKYMDTIQPENGKIEKKLYHAPRLIVRRHDWCTRCGIKRSWDCSITLALIYKEIERGGIN